MSFKYALFRLLLRAIGFKKAMGGDAETILAKARARNAKNQIPVLYDDAIEIEPKPDGIR